jgi:hypothetical protein
VGGVAREIQDFDLFVTHLEVAARELVLVDRLQHHAAIEQEEGVVAADLFRQLLRAVDVEHFVHFDESLLRLAGVERRAEGFRLVGVTGAADGSESRESDGDA